MNGDDRLTADAIRAGMTPTAASRLARIDCVASVDSTNAELLRRGSDQPDLALLIADGQSAGRGRRGRIWQSPPGANLYLSMYRRLSGSPNAWGGLSLVVGIACAEALHALGHVEVRLKWPNDLLARGRKLGGVLIELAPGAAVIGVGLNVRVPTHAAAQIDQPWIDLATLGSVPSRARTVSTLLEHLLPALDRFDAEGLEPFRARWHALDALDGQPIQLLAGAEHLAGEAIGIADDGGLRVRLAEGVRVFHSADVSLRLP